MDNIFELLMFLVVIGTSVFRFLKGRKTNKTYQKLQATAPLLNASTDPGGRSISGKIDNVPFKIKYEPKVESSPERVEISLRLKIPFTLDIDVRSQPYDPAAVGANNEVLMADRNFDEQFCITTDNPDACRSFLLDPLFHQGIMLVMNEGFLISFTRRQAVMQIPGSDWLSEAEPAALKLKNATELCYSLVAEFE